MNLSQIKREKMMAFLKKLKEENSGNEENLIAINEIENELNNKKYGLIWEEHEENVDKMMEDNVPVFVEDKSREIKANEDEYNFLLEGDNLHSLYLLEKTHKGKIDVIYIDPPYNTETADGDSAFVYNDNMVDKNDNFRNSKWLSFMNIRLSKAKSLLSSKGIIFISIDDNEFANLKVLCDEIFGSINYVACLPTIMNLKGNQDQYGFAGTHEYTLVYTNNKNIAKFNEFNIDDEQIEEEWEEDEIGLYKKGATLKRTGNDAPREKRPLCFYPILIKNKKVFVIKDEEYKKIYNREKKEFNDSYLEELKQKYEANNYIFVLPMIDNYYASWRWGFETCCIDKEEIIVTDENTLYKKQRPEIGELPTIKPKTLFYSPLYSSGNGTKSLKDIFNKKVFNNPKPPKLLKDFIILSTDKKSIILDFFAGSGTTAQAVLELNKEDGGNRHFILCTNNENNICEDVTYKRIKTVITGKRDDGSIYSDGIPANLKYYKTDFVKKDTKNLSRDLSKHIKELIQLENGVDIDNDNWVMILTEEDAEKFEKNINKYKNLKGVYRARSVVWTKSQKVLLKGKEDHIIPDYYFNNELKEVGENW